jgi:hypothetical protein
MIEFVVATCMNSSYRDEKLPGVTVMVFLQTIHTTEPYTYHLLSVYFLVGVKEQVKRQRDRRDGPSNATNLNSRGGSPNHMA